MKRIFNQLVEKDNTLTLESVRGDKFSTFNGYSFQVRMKSGRCKAISSASGSILKSYVARPYGNYDAWLRVMAMEVIVRYVRIILGASDFTYNSQLSSYDESLISEYLSEIKNQYWVSSVNKRERENTYNINFKNDVLEFMFTKEMVSMTNNKNGEVIQIEKPGNEFGHFDRRMLSSLAICAGFDDEDEIRDSLEAISKQIVKNYIHKRYDLSKYPVIGLSKFFSKINKIYHIPEENAIVYNGSSVEYPGMTKPLAITNVDEFADNLSFREDSRLRGAFLTGLELIRIRKEMQYEIVTLADGKVEYPAYRLVEIL